MICFRKHANSNKGFTCGIDIGPVATVTAVAEVLYQPYVPAVIAVVGVPATATSAEVVAVIGVPKVLEVNAVPEVLAVAAKPPIQRNFRGIFQNRISNWNSQILIAITKPNVFKKNSPQHQILHYNSSQGYSTLLRNIFHHQATYVGTQTAALLVTL